MSKVWSDERKFQIWLDIEVLACEAMAELGQIPNEDAQEIRKRARFSIPKSLRSRQRTNHDVIAFLENVAGFSGALQPAGFIRGLPSSDILDTTLAVQLNESCDILLADLKSFRTVIGQAGAAVQNDTYDRAQPRCACRAITFGLKLALMYDEFGRAEERLAQTRERIRVGKISGAVGTHAHIDPKIERTVCEKLGLKPATLSTQIVQRDRHAEFMTVLAVIASSIDRWATEFSSSPADRGARSGRIFGEGQKGSSAMPHKRNPITNERLSRPGARRSR
jgi:adenylosuccinate lyase